MDNNDAKDAKDAKDEYRELLIKVGRNINSCRKSYGITQEQLAEKIGMSESTIHKLEAPGQAKSPSVHTLWLISKALDVNVNQFFDDSDDDKTD